MRPCECALLGFIAALACAGARADPSDYGKVDTFQPGKKYNCVPTADRKGWNCTEAGKATAPPTQTPTAAAPATPAAPAASPALTAPVAASGPPPSAPAKSPGSLPSYLTNAAASGVQPMPAAPTPKPPPRPRAKGPLVPAAAPAPPTAATSAPVAKPASAPVTVTPPTPASQPAPVTPAPTPVATGSGNARDFLALPADAYVIELAHAENAANLVTTNPPRENVYKLHLRQNGGDIWLLVCGPYASLEAARAGRDELAAQGATPGWPRKIGPLQTEVRRTQP
jgi:hypothetical protein